MCGPVEILTPNGVANDHRLVHAGPSPKFSLSVAVVEHQAPLRFLGLDPPKAGLRREELAIGSKPLERVESIVSELITEPP